MKICLAQTKSIKGDVDGNISMHIESIQSAIAEGADLIVFPELSLTGYEPSLAAELATHSADPRFDRFQQLSDSGKITIGVGMPTKSDDGIHISMILFQPLQPRLAYSKKYLHADEEPFFSPGQNFPTLEISGVNVAFAICYEISIPEHVEKACQSGADVYVASVAKHKNGMLGASERLAEIARKYSIPALISNCTGPADNFVGAGMSGVWDSSGSLVQQLDREAGLVFYDLSSASIK